MNHHLRLWVTLGACALTVATFWASTAVADESAVDEFAADESVADGLPPDPAAEGLAPGERFDALVARTHYEQGKLRTLQARFVQLKQSELLLEPEESTGMVWYRLPNQVRWDFETPTILSVLVKDREMTTWYQESNRVERLDIGRHGERFLQLLGPGSSLVELQRYFEIRVTFPVVAADPYRLVLAPLSSRLKKRLHAVNIHLHPELYIPVYLRYEEASGDQTEISFDAIQINVELSVDRFDPPGEVAKSSIPSDR